MTQRYQLSRRLQHLYDLLDYWNLEYERAISPQEAEYAEGYIKHYTKKITEEIAPRVERIRRSNNHYRRVKRFKWYGAIALTIFVLAKYEDIIAYFHAQDTLIADWIFNNFLR